MDGLQSKAFTTKYTKNHEEKQKTLLNFVSFVLFVVYLPMFLLEL